MEKYFVIGFNKTATVTFHELFLQNGLKSYHNGHQAYKSLLEYNYIWTNLDSYTCFSDNGDDQDFKMLEAKYPNSIFILNIRRLDEWLISRFKHGLKYNHSWAFPSSKEKCKEWIDNREGFYREILEYFKDKPNKLIIVSINEENWIEYICSELQFKNTNIKSKNIFPTDESKHQNIINIVNETFDELSYSGDHRKNILFKDISLTEKYLRIFKNNIGPSVILNRPSKIEYNDITKNQIYSKIYVLAMMKNEGDILKEWIDHYRLFGADKIFLIDDGSTDDSCDIASSYGGYVTLYNARELADERGRQPTAYNKYFGHLIGQDSWALICDIDEFIFPIKTNTFQETLSQFNCDQISMPAHQFGFMPNKVQPKSIIESNKLRSNTVVEIIKDNTQLWLMKSFFKLNALTAINNPHKQKVNGETISANTDILRFNHYFAQSEEHIIKRLIRGGGNKWRLSVTKEEAEKELATTDWSIYHEIEDISLINIYKKRKNIAIDSNVRTPRLMNIIDKKVDPFLLNNPIKKLQDTKDPLIKIADTKNTGYLNALKMAGELLSIKNKKLKQLQDKELHVSLNMLRANNPSIDPKKIEADLNAVITPSIKSEIKQLPIVVQVIKEQVEITIPAYAKPTKKDMAVLLVYFNTCEYKKLAQNCSLIYQTLVRSQIPVFLVEHCFKDQIPLFPENGTNIFNTRSNSYMFYKENLINWLMPKVPEQYTKFYMMDCDLLFEKDTWYDDVSELLETHDILQPFQEAIWLDSDLKTVDNKRDSSAYLFSKTKTLSNFIDSHPGFAWAIRRDFFQSIGFFDLDIFCNADIIFGISIFKINNASYKELQLSRIIKCNTPYYNEYLLKFNNSRITYYPQTVYHLWHGSIKNRNYMSKYTEIHDITKDIKTNDELLELNSYGVYEYTIKYREKLNMVILNYFKDRNEDGI